MAARAATVRAVAGSESGCDEGSCDEGSGEARAAAILACLVSHAAAGCARRDAASADAR